MGQPSTGQPIAATPFSGFTPEISGETCLLAVSAVSRCDACAQICPSGAILIDDNGLNIDEEACVGCGLCIPSCPEGAIASFYRPRLYDFNGFRTAFVACRPALRAFCVEVGTGSTEQNAANKDFSPRSEDGPQDSIPCLNALGLRDMAAIQRKGADLVILASCQRETCLTNDGNRIENVIALAKAMFTSRNERFPEIRMVDPADWQRMRGAAKACNPGRVVDRRGLLSMFASRKDAEENNGMLATGAFGFPRKTPDDIAAFIPRIDAGRCTGCNACAQTCPHGAIDLNQGTDGIITEYTLDPAGCTGCKICVDICEDGAVSLVGPGKATPQVIAIATAHCDSCGAQFHYPQAQKDNRHSCRICAKTGKTKKLFFVHGQE